MQEKERHMVYWPKIGVAEETSGILVKAARSCSERMAHVLAGNGGYCYIVRRKPQIDLWWQNQGVHTAQYQDILSQKAGQWLTDSRILSTFEYRESGAGCCKSPKS